MNLSRTYVHHMGNTKNMTRSGTVLKKAEEVRDFGVLVIVHFETLKQL